MKTFKLYVWLLEIYNTKSTKRYIFLKFVSKCKIKNFTQGNDPWEELPAGTQCCFNAQNWHLIVTLHPPSNTPFIRRKLANECNYTPG